MRIALIAGLPRTGKTSALLSVAKHMREFSFIANNIQSEDMLRNVCTETCHFKFKSPCARIRQFEYMIDCLEQKNADFIIAEPPGACEEESAPMINNIIFRRKDVEISSLITFIHPNKIINEVNKKTMENIRIWNMIYESDIVVISFSDTLDSIQRLSCVNNVKIINPEAEVLFLSTKTEEGIEKLAYYLENGVYKRPLSY